MRYVGCLLIALAGAGMGLYGAYRLRHRAVYLQRAAHLLQVLERRVPHTAQPMGVLWRQLAAEAAYEDCGLLQDTAAALSDVSFAAAYTAAVERAQAAGWLTPAGYGLLMEFGAGCGRYDLERQTEHIRHYRCRCEDLAAELQQNAATGGKLYRTGGIAVGVALALLLL